MFYAGALGQVAALSAKKAMGWHADLGYQRAQRISPAALTRVRQRVCAHYVAMRELMCPAQTLRHRAVGMLL